MNAIGPISLIVALVMLLPLGASATDDLEPRPPWEALERMLEDEGIETTRAALMRLAASRAEDTHRWTAIEILGLRGEVEAAGMLRELAARDKSELLRQTAALALARLGEQEGVSALEEFLHREEDPTRRLFLAARLAEFGVAAGYDSVVEAARADAVGLRYSSVAALTAHVPLSADLMPPPELLLLELGRDESPKVRKEVLIQLPLVTEKGADAEVFCSLVTEMANRDADPKIREMADLFRTHGAFQVCRAQSGALGDSERGEAGR